MDQVQQRILIAAASAVLVLGAEQPPQHFYPDDPIWKMPRPAAVANPLKRNIDYLYDFLVGSVATPGEKQVPGAEIRSQDVNTLGEVPDSEWYTNRHYWHPMSIEQLRRGPARGNEPVPPFRIVGAKSEGISPGFQFRDARGRRYFCKPDPPSNPEMATAADVIGSKFFYALGYNVPENHIAYFTTRELSMDPSAKITPKGGKQRRMHQADLDRVLRKMPLDREGRYRVVASLEVEGKSIGPFRWYGTRQDDPNDVVPHERRRELRGLYVFCAWLNHTDIKAGNTFDSVVQVNGVPVIRHHLIDFGSMLGSDSDQPKNARFGHEYMIEKDKGAIGKIFSLGLYSPDWERAHFPHLPAAGNFEARTFVADKWTSNYPVRAFLNRLPDDDFWGAKQVMAFSPVEIRAMVETGEYSDPQVVDYITDTLVERRDKIGRCFFEEVLPLDRFEVKEGRLSFEDLAAKYGFHPVREYRIQWLRFDNKSGRTTPLEGASGAAVPEGDYVVAEIREPVAESKAVRVYVYSNKVVGIDRTW